MLVASALAFRSPAPRCSTPRCSLLSPSTASLVVFTDCDGTMLNPDHRLSARTESTLAALAEAGVLVVPATGRARAGSWTASVLSSLPGAGSPGIYLNGCSVVDEQGALTRTLLPPGCAERALAYAAATDGARLTPCVYAGDEALVQRQNDVVARLAAVGDSPIRQVPDLAGACAALDVSKVLLLMDEEGERMSDYCTADGAFQSGLAEAVGEGAGITQALSWAIEVVPAAADKATAARALCSRWGVPEERVVAIGDGQNDIELLAFAGERGLSVAMANGADAVKAAAQHVTGSNGEDGWSDAMERLVLTRL